MAHYSSSSSSVSDSIGAAPQPTYPRPFHFENLNASSSAGAQPTCTLQLIDCVQGQGVAASRNQQNGPFANENNIQLQLGRTLPEEVFDMIKTLTRWDVNPGQCRLLLKTGFAENHILPYIIDAGQFRISNRIPIAVWDADEVREFHLTLMRRPGNDTYALIGKWNDFVNEAGLKEGDKVGFTYVGSTLLFKRLN